MAVNLIDNEEIYVNQDGSDITLEIQADALKNKNVVVGSIRSKNMLNQNIYDLGYYDNSGTFTNSSTNVVFSYIPVESNKNYVFSAVSNCQNIAIVEFDSSKTFIKRNILYSNKSISITTTSTTKYIRCQLNYNNSTITKDIIDTLKPQFETGDTATAYSPYQNLNLEIKSKYVSGTPDSNGFLPTGLDVNNIIIGVAGISINAGFFTPFIEKNVNRLTIECKTWDQHPITTSVSFTVYYIEI